jgi:hypothetical protein
LHISMLLVNPNPPAFLLIRSVKLFIEEWITSKHRHTDAILF